MKRVSSVVLLPVAATLLPGARALAQSTPPETAPRIDLSRYVGQWFEIARYPNRFQRNCSGDVVVTCTRRDDGRITVDNRCRRADGSVDRAGGCRAQHDAGSATQGSGRFV